MRGTAKMIGSCIPCRAKQKDVDGDSDDPARRNSSRMTSEARMVVLMREDGQARKRGAMFFMSDEYVNQAVKAWADERLRHVQENRYSNSGMAPSTKAYGFCLPFDQPTRTSSALRFAQPPTGPSSQDTSDSEKCGNGFNEDLWSLSVEAYPQPVTAGALDTVESAPSRKSLSFDVEPFTRSNRPSPQSAPPDSDCQRPTGTRELSGGQGWSSRLKTQRGNVSGVATSEPNPRPRPSSNKRLSFGGPPKTRNYTTLVPAPHRAISIDTERRYIHFCTQCKRKNGGLANWLPGKPTDGGSSLALQSLVPPFGMKKSHSSSSLFNTEVSSEPRPSSWQRLSSFSSKKNCGDSMGRDDVNRMITSEMATNQSTNQSTVQSTTQSSCDQDYHHPPIFNIHPSPLRRRSLVTRTVAEGGVAYGPPITIQTDLPLPDQLASYLEVELDGLESIPEDTMVAVGIAPFGYPSHQVPGVLSGSISFTSVGHILLGNPQPEVACNRMQVGDVIGMLIYKNKGIVTFSHNGEPVRDVAFKPLLNGEPLHVTISFMGVGHVEVNFGCKSFVRKDMFDWGFGVDLARLKQLEAELGMFYKAHNSVALSRADRDARAYLGRESELNSHLNEVYGETLVSLFDCEDEG